MSYIKREDAIDVLYREKRNALSQDFDDIARGIQASINCLSNLPSADVIEPKRGEWKRRIVDNGFNADWVCSECGYRVKTDFVDYNFCPNCGADMRNCSEKPNNCETCKWGEWYRKGYDITMMSDECGGCCSWNNKWTPKDEPQTDCA